MTLSLSSEYLVPFDALICDDDFFLLIVPVPYLDHFCDSYHGLNFDFLIVTISDHLVLFHVNLFHRGATSDICLHNHDFTKFKSNS